MSVLSNVLSSPALVFPSLGNTVKYIKMSERFCSSVLGQIISGVGYHNVQFEDIDPDEIFEIIHFISKMSCCAIWTIAQVNSSTNVEIR